MSVAQLKAQLQEKGLAVSGTKARLESRLRMTQDWERYDDTVYILNNFYQPKSFSANIASYDIDGTLITPTDPTKIWSEGVDDWNFRDGMLETVKIKQRQSYTILLFTNQARKVNKHITLARIQKVVEAIGECAVFVATGRDQYRKPETGMWDLAVRFLHLNPDLKKSFYMGDASGEKGSFSDSDKLFAENIGIPFLAV